MRGVTIVPNARAMSVSSRVRRIGCTADSTHHLAARTGSDPRRSRSSAAARQAGAPADGLHEATGSCEWRRLGRQIQEDGGQLGGGQSVSHGVMESLDETDTTPVQSFDKGQIPQWAGPIKRNPHQIGAEPAEFHFRGGRSERADTYMLGDIEVGIVEPCRWCLTEGLGDGRCRSFGTRCQPAGDQTADVGYAEVPLRVVEMPTIEDAHRRHVHRRRCGLCVQKGSFERGEGLQSGHGRVAARKSTPGR